MSVPKITSIPPTMDKTRNRSTYASFGDDGVTATTTAYGHLLRISQYFGEAPFGFYSIDLNHALEPYCVARRLEQLQNHIADPDKGMRLEIGGLITPDAVDEIPSMSFLNNCWPKFVSKPTDRSFATEIQYFVSQKTVYQSYTFTFRDESSAKLHDMAISTELLIRDPDFTQRSVWNAQNISNSSYKHWAPEGKNCILRMHEIGTENYTNANGLTKNAILAKWPFINDFPQNVRPERDTAKYIITPDGWVTDGLKKDGKITVTVAYTLHLASPSEAEHIPPPCLSMEILRELKAEAQNFETSFTDPLFLNEEHLDFALKRNLEHILSVCSIPIFGDPEEDIRPIVLTCGDMSGHRVANEASFSAFQFLLLAFQHFDSKLDIAHRYCKLQNRPCSNFGCQMRFRIWRVCRGHLKWITDHMETKDGLVGSQYWATGWLIMAEQDSPLPQKSLMEAPFHIIKVAEFCRPTEDRKARDEIRKNPRLVEIIRKWVETLDRENKHGLYAFPRPRKEAPIYSFYFSDHAIIWWAAKSVEYLGLGQRLQVEKGACYVKHKPRNMSYSSDEIQTNIIKRFTTENPILKKRMIAISRNTIETRFLIREKETRLFSALELGLLDKPLSPLTSGSPEKIGAWTNTLDCQAQHEDYQNTQWDHPLQFALAILMSSNGVRINSKSAAEMMHYSISTLLNSSSLNGLFPGQLDEDNNPVIFMKDVMVSSKKVETKNYWNIPHTHTSIEAQFTKQPQASYMTSTELNQALDNMFKRLSAAFLTPGLSTINGKLAMKKSVPFKNFIDQKNIVELQDEWMYNEPEFFGFFCKLSRDCDLTSIVCDDVCLFVCLFYY
ncbi:hypothetical protein ACQKWADRAFT_323751 [Trichoderma austrokoningii]